MKDETTVKNSDFQYDSKLLRVVSKTTRPILFKTDRPARGYSGITAVRRILADILE